MSELKLNKKNFRALTKYLKTIRPSQYKQSSWCGTACCIGGHECKRLGWRKVKLSMVTKQGVREFARIVAANSLGINIEDPLFEATAQGWHYEHEFRMAKRKDQLAIAIKELEYRLAHERIRRWSRPAAYMGNLEA